MEDTPPDLFEIPEPFSGWLAGRGWRLRSHQVELLMPRPPGRGALVIAPTGGGKTLAGFLPSLVDLSRRRRPRGGALHTLYISPLKALASDVARNLSGPVDEMRLDIQIETRSGDTSADRRRRQRANPPDIMLTTPEQVALLLASEHAGVYFRDLKTVIVDEVHALASTKRGDLLALGIGALGRHAPGLRRIGLSATVKDAPSLADWLGKDVDIIRAPAGARPDVRILEGEERAPWAGHSARHLAGEVYRSIRDARMTLVFVNTRAQAEAMFQELWRRNDDGLAIGLHHGSLDREQRERIEAAMAEGRLRAVVCTSTLDLGIDWGDVDLTIQIGAPKGAARLIQRIGRSNHRLDTPSEALLAPANRFEELECRAAIEAVYEGDMETPPIRRGGLDVLAQHIMGCACGDGFEEEALFAEVKGTSPFRDLDRETFSQVIGLVSTGGYALRGYDRFRRIVRSPADGLWRARSEEVRRRHRMNVGVIIDNPMITVRLEARLRTTRRDAPAAPGTPGRALGQVEEGVIEAMTQGDTFVFAGEVLRFERLEGDDAIVTRSDDPEASIPAYSGGRFPLSDCLAARVRNMVDDRNAWRRLSPPVREWLEIQETRSEIPGPGDLLVETFPRGDRFFLACYPFEGRLAHQTLGMLLTRRLERGGLRPLGFVATDYALAVWGLRDLSSIDVDALFHPDMLGDDLDAWLQESAMMKRTFSSCAVVSGLIERRRPGAARRGRPVMMSTDLIYDVLRSHEPDHILLRAAREEAAGGLLDIRRLGEALARFSGRIRVSRLGQVSPFAVPLILEVGRETIRGGEAAEAILMEAEAMMSGLP